MHKLIGKLYVISMVGLNVIAFSIYEMFGGFGIFHWAATLSSLTILGGIGVLIFRRKIKNWVSIHYDLMVWSYIGLLAATSNEIFVHVPVFNELAKNYQYVPIVSMLLVFIIGGVWASNSQEKTTSRFMVRE